MSSLRSKLTFCIVFIFLFFSVYVFAERSYTHVITVGIDKDYTTINEAIAAMLVVDPPLDADHLGCIEVYEGIYYEHLNDYYENSYNLPSHCDLTGMGQTRDDVEIRHAAFAIYNDVNQAGIKGNGDNHISHIKLFNYFDYPEYYWQKGISLQEDSRLEDCSIESWHGAVSGGDNFIVNNCEISTMFGSCIYVSGTFEITNSQLYPLAYQYHCESPTGIMVGTTGSGIIENVTIESYVQSIEDSDAQGLFGICLLHGTDKEVLISNVDIDIQLTSFFYPNRPDYIEPMWVCGILLGKAYTPGYYNGHTIITNSSINVSGIESPGDDPGPEDDGGGLLVSGITVRGSGSAEIMGNTDITTSRSVAGHAEEGYEYSLNNEMGFLGVHIQDAVTYDDNKVHGVIAFIPIIENITQETYHPSIQDAIDHAGDGDEIVVYPGVYEESLLVQYTGPTGAKCR